MARRCAAYKYVTKRVCNKYGCYGTRRVRVCGKYA